MVERHCIRVFVAAALCLALTAFLLVPIPVDAEGDPALPAPAFEQPGLYRLEIALMVFYGGLLLITPTFSGLVRGRLPIEISSRGARFAEETDRTAELDLAAIRELEQTTTQLAEEVIATNLEIEGLKKNREVTEGD